MSDENEDEFLLTGVFESNVPRFEFTDKDKEWLLGALGDLTVEKSDRFLREL
tara:strand:- start:6059 stop:6214 length:156 start_codon:yes stop_codon:yes gene_type:complete